MRNETKLLELVSLAPATPVCSALYTSLLGIETIEAPACCHMAAKVGPAERIFRPLISSGLRMQARLEATAPASQGAAKRAARASQASAKTTTPALSIFALISFMNGDSLSRAARS